MGQQLERKRSTGDISKGNIPGKYEKLGVGFGVKAKRPEKDTTSGVEKRKDVKRI